MLRSSRWLCGQVVLQRAPTGAQTANPRRSPTASSAGSLVRFVVMVVAGSVRRCPGLAAVSGRPPRR